MAFDQKEQKKYHGVIVPMITPLTNEGELDEPAVRRVVDHLVGGGVHGIFILGTTGEGPSVPRDVRPRMVHVALEAAAGRVPVYAGVFDSVVAESIEAARDYLKRGAAAVVAQLPSYFRLTADEQFRYFAALTERVRGPVMLYDIPEIVHMSIDPGVIEHLRVFPNIVGIKDSSSDRARLEALLESYCGDSGFCVLVGSSALAAYGMENGADGFVPSAGNLNPALCARLYAAAQTGDTMLMNNLQADLDALQAEFAVDGYPGRGVARLKQRMAQRGLCGPRVYAPLAMEEPVAK